MLRAFFLFGALSLTAMVSVSACGDEPLHRRIDQLTAAAVPNHADIAAGLSSDAEFVRRVHLDLVGMIPTAEETRNFLANQAADKRTQLVDALLQDPRHARRMQYVFDEMLIERQSGANVPDPEWREYLRQSFLSHKPWDRLAREILSADGQDQRAAAKFYLVRNADTDMVTRDIGRLFLGVNLECAQCHDHPDVSDYYQRHYFGITAFVQRTYLFTDPTTKLKVLGEKAEGDVKFTSVFTQESGETAPRIMDLEAIPDPEGVEKQYLLKPSKEHRGVPKYSRREQLARRMAVGDNKAFRLNIVNRLWALMVGRGLVEPLDLHTSDNPAVNPELLDLLAEELLQHDYDLDFLIRELALSEVYQRSSAAPEKPSPPESFTVGLLKPLSPEQLAWSVMQAAGLQEITLASKTAGQEAINKKLAKAAAAAAEFAALPYEEPPGPDYQEPPAPERNLQPTPLPVDTSDLLWREETLHDALQGNVQQFITMFAAEGQTTQYQAAPNQALFFINGPLIRGWLTPRAGNLTDRLVKTEQPEQFAEELFLSVLSRMPSSDETAEVVEYLSLVESKAEAAQELVWALLSSAEFRFNH